MLRVVYLPVVRGCRQAHRGSLWRGRTRPGELWRAHELVLDPGAEMAYITSLAEHVLEAADPGEIVVERMAPPERGYARRAFVEAERRVFARAIGALGRGVICPAEIYV